MAARKKSFYIIPGAYSMIGIGTIFRRRAGSGGPLPPDYAKWIKEHMVFWYDMSKPVDTYAENFNDWTKFTGAKYTVTNKSVNITNFDAVNNASIYIAKSKKFNGITITVDGLLDGQEIAWGYNNNPLVRMPKNGTYTLEPIDSVTGNIGFRSINIVGACNITITQLPSGQSVPTNEILKANPYLQDFSGNNRPLKLNNFLFAAMSGVGGYELNWTDQSIWARFLGSRFNGAIEPHKLTVTSALGSYNIMETKVPSYAKKFKVRIDGIVDETVAYKYINASGTLVSFDIKEDGEYELPSNNTVEGNYNMGWAILVNSYPHTCNITIEQIPSYPNALVTDGVDDYGVVENFKSLQNYMMFYQCAVIKPTGTSKGMFSTISDSNNTNGWVLLQNQGKNISRFGNGAYMNVQLPDDSEAKTDYIVTGNGNKMTLYVGDKTQTLNGTYTSTGSTMGYFLSDYSSLTRFGSLAFYKSILFDSVPTKETDGFTEQELIDYVLENLITK
jgi:hypothetical protein